MIFLQKSSSATQIYLDKISIGQSSYVTAGVDTDISQIQCYIAIYN